MPSSVPYRDGTGRFRDGMVSPSRPGMPTEWDGMAGMGRDGTGCIIDAFSPG